MVLFDFLLGGWFNLYEADQTELSVLKGLDTTKECHVNTPVEVQLPRSRVCGFFFLQNGGYLARVMTCDSVTVAFGQFQATLICPALVCLVPG